MRRITRAKPHLANYPLTFDDLEAQVERTTNKTIHKQTQKEFM
jgi:hypothetical protein